MSLSADRIFASYNGGSSLHALSMSLFARQQEEWEQLRRGCAELAFLERRRFAGAYLDFILQCNPRRIKSAGADITPSAIRARPCFLCAANLPQEQKAVLMRKNYLLLCNPFPIFQPHFTVAHVSHLPQALGPTLPSFLQAAQDLAPLALLYNGARCGASAPDHLHFQAFPAGELPVLNAGPGSARVVSGSAQDGALMLKGTTGPSPFLIVEGHDKRDVAGLVRRFLKVLGRTLSFTGEPPVNLFCLYGRDKWRVFIFPRKKHRPDAYYLPAGQNLLISPGAVDMGGLVIAARGEDFHRLDGPSLRQIIAEVSLTEEELARIVASL